MKKFTNSVTVLDRLTTFRTISLGALCGALLTVADPSHARDVNGETVNWAPHYGAEVEDGGALTVITKEALRRAGHEASVDYIAWNRALKNVEEGSADFVMGAYYNAERAQKYIFSDPVYAVEIGLVSLDDFEMDTVNTLDDLRSYTIGVSLGYANTEEFDNAEYLNKQPAPTPKLNMRKLYRKRVDMVAGAFDILRYEAVTEGLNTRRLKFLQPPLQSNGLYLMFSRAIPDGQALADGFNRALQEMRSDGTMRSILAKYLNR
ncbi:MAG: transporter substrate-binding domain-containing protein [Pseudomonadota bacterium]